MKVLICGSRHYSDFERVLACVRSLGDAVIISGGCRGADALAVRAARTCGLSYREYPAQWEQYGRAAGPIRNQRMLDMECPDLVVAFHANISSSRVSRF